LGIIDQVISLHLACANYRRPATQGWCGSSVSEGVGSPGGCAGLIFRARNGQRRLRLRKNTEAILEVRLIIMLSR